MIPREEYIDHPLYGRRVLHFMSPVRWSGSRYEHEKCSNYKVLNKTVTWLPMCHHYLLTPPNHTIPDDRENVTLIPFDYAQSVTLNRGHFNAKQLIKSFNWRAQDIDFIFNHQPEQTYNIMNAVQSGRYGAHAKLFNFFHWIDTPQTKPTDVFPDGFLRQIESIHLADNTFFHCEESLKYLKKNFQRRKIENAFTGINEPFVKDKIRYMPLGVNHDVEPEPFPLPKDKKILVFNHRWAVTTGVKKLIEFTEKLSDEYLIWVTDGNALHPRAGQPAPANFHVEALPYAKYLYLLENCLATLCFVDGYMTWNLSVQDSISFDTPSLVFEHPTHKHVLGDNYPYTFKTEEEFLKLLRFMPLYEHIKNGTTTHVGELPIQSKSWILPPHDQIFETNLIETMAQTMKNTRVPVSKYNEEWYHHIIKLQDSAFKAHLLKNSHPDLYSSNVWEGLRLKAMDVGIKDDPTSKFTRFFIPNDVVRTNLYHEINGQSFEETKLDMEFEKKELENDIREKIKKEVTREKANNSKAVEFFNL